MRSRWWALEMSATPSGQATVPSTPQGSPSICAEAERLNAPFDVGTCTKHVHLAAEAAGTSGASRSEHAKEYGPFILSRGAREVDKLSCRPSLADLVIVQAVLGHPSGHVQA
jgi:hypothetical protein